MITSISFEEIEQVWFQEDMWGSEPFVYPVSTMMYLEDHNMKIKDLSYSQPVFYAYMLDGEIAGVNSYHKVNDEQCRSRGLYVYPKYRKMNVGYHLLRYAIESNKKYKFIWSFPRVSAAPIYRKAGFRITSERHIGKFSDNYYCRYDYENSNNGT